MQFTHKILYSCIDMDLLTEKNTKISMHNNIRTTKYIKIHELIFKCYLYVLNFKFIICFQEEADTRIILHCLHIATHCPYSSAIVVRSPDTDVFMLLLKFSQKIRLPLIMDTGVSDKRRLINITSVSTSISNDLCTAMVSFHAFTGCDTVSVFIRKGKLLPLRLLQKNPQYIPVFTRLGTTAELDQQMLSDLESFSCLMYGAKSGEHNIDKLRYTMFMTRFTTKGPLLSSDTGIDLSLLPPCKSSLKMHCLRANYQALIWNTADLANPNLPKPHGHGWALRGDKLEYQWSSGKMLPQELVELVSDDKEEEDNREDIISDYYNIFDDYVEEEEEDDCTSDSDE
eukprot:GHVR01100473.1.p1 GENE.GHVR01100473.1~~GHVR01100473.1.p1  ORF type:complete len:342 (+),score=36.08 GHVR01100473.1:35-1060(+)